jgi:hypothetical protein
MAGRGPQTFKKRQKEQQRKEKQAEKLARRLQRKHEKASGEGGDEGSHTDFEPGDDEPVGAMSDDADASLEHS